jgi:hypothetical protein
MKCTDAHLAIGAEPQGTSPELEQHLRECASCAQYRREMRDLDAQIHRAMKIDMAALKTDAPVRPAVRLVSNVPPAPTGRRPWLANVTSHWAMAASVLVALGVIFVLWGALPRHSLAADVVAHVVSEPMPSQPAPLPPPALEGVLQGANVKMDPINNDVLFAQTCFFRGRLVPHFVVQSGDAAVTVLVLQDEQLKGPEHFAGSGYDGVIVPVKGHGSVAVLSRKRIDADREAQEIVNALHFLTPTA